MIALWDGLVALLVLFPLLTGGIWISRPGLFVELSDLAVPVLIVGVFALALRRKDFGGSRILRAARRVWEIWSRALAEHRKRTLMLGCLAVGALWLLECLVRHWSVNEHVMDLSIFHNAIWNLAHGNGYISSPKGGISLFADHQSPLFWIFAPLIRAFPGPETLLVIQSFALAWGAWPLYRIGEQTLARGSKWLPALPLLYWAYLPLRNAANFDFHVEVLMLPLFLAAIAGLQSLSTRSRVWGGGALLLALAAKESAPLIGFGMGIAWILGAAPESSRAFTRKVGGVLLVLTPAIFIFYTRWIPSWLGSSYAYQSQYAHLGSSLGEIALSPFKRPEAFFSSVFGASRLKYLFWTVGSLAFAPLWNPKPLLAAAPAYLILFLAAGDHRVQIIWHYGPEVAVGLFWALPLGLERMKIPGVRAWAWVLFWSLALFGRSELARVRQYSMTPHAKWLREEVVPSVSPDVSVAAPVALTSHLSMRFWIAWVPYVKTKSGEYVNCVIFDPSIRNDDMRPGQSESLVRELQGAGFSRVYQCGSLEVYERGTGCLTRQPACPYSQ